MPPTNLPRWAQVSHNSNINDESTSTSISLEEEELYLWVQAYNVLARQIDDALHSAIDKRLDALVVSIDAVFQKCIGIRMHKHVHDVNGIHDIHDARSVQSTNSKTLETANPFVTELIVVPYDVHDGW